MPKIPTNPFLTRQDVVARLTTAIGTQSQAAYADSIGVSEGYIGDIRAGRRHPGPKVLTPLGLEKCPAPYDPRYRVVSRRKP